MKRRIAAVLMALLFVVAVPFTVFAVSAPTSWDDVDEEAQTLGALYMQYVYWVTSGVDISTDDALQYLSDSMITWLHWSEALGWYLSPLDDAYYYLYNGELYLFEGDISTAAAGDGGRARSGEGGGSGKLRVTGDSFNDITTSINNANYYIPEVTSERKVLSFQTQPYDSFRKISYSSFALPLRYGSDLFLGLDWSEVYLCPFITDDDNVDGTYYGLYQFRLYHEVTEDNIVQIYMDVIPFIDESQAAEHILVCDNVAAYPYIIISPYFFETMRVFNLDGNATLQDFIQFQNHRNYICYNNSTYSQLMSTQSNMFAAGYSLLAASTMQLLNNTNDDAGYICQQTPFVIDYSPIPDAVTQIPTNYYITINGDNIYDYGVTDPDTNETTTINYYITNNNFPSEDGGEDSGSGGSSGSVGGDVTVSGNIDVGGSVDININVNDNSGTGDSGSGEDIPSYIDENFNVLDYLKMLPTLSDGFKEYISGVFDWLPADLLALIIGGVAVAIFCRLAGR